MENIVYLYFAYLCAWSWRTLHICQDKIRVCLVVSALLCKVLILQGCAVTCRLIISVLTAARLLSNASTAMIKRDALKGRKPFQFTPVTSWMPSIHLDQDGRSFSSPSHSVTGSFSSTRAHFSSESLSPTFHLRACFFSSLPSPHFPPRSLPSPFLSAEAPHQSRWLVSNC